MNYDCYTSIYSEDPLEFGEIDVRKKSFKGCFQLAFNKVKGLDFFKIFGRFLKR